MGVEDLIINLLNSIFQASSTLNLLLVILVIFLISEASRLLKEHRDMRQRLTQLESKILAYENIGIMDNIYNELRGEHHAKPTTSKKKE